MTRTCKYCKKPFDSRNTVGRHKVRNFCTKKCKFAQISKTKTGVKIGPMPLAWREKIGEAQRGERHHNWKGGVYDSMERKIRHSLEYREWRRHVDLRFLMVEHYVFRVTGKQQHMVEEVLKNTSHKNL
jgi:hypothetical protein